jgi:hypothetical protein
MLLVLATERVTALYRIEISYLVRQPVFASRNLELLVSAEATTHDMANHSVFPLQVPNSLCPAFSYLKSELREQTHKLVGEAFFKDWIDVATHSSAGFVASCS